MTNPTTAKPRRRFAPIPIETTFEQYRQTGPTAELTPSPSPRSPSPRSPSPPPPAAPVHKEKRRFAPQLVESSVRRSRRAGDEGPATRPSDRTDITPYTKHIYVAKAKKRPGQTPASRRAGHARRESCDDEIAGDVFDLVARDAQLKLQEVAMSAFPNSGIRIGGAEHFYVREGSDDDSIPSRGRTTVRGPGARRTLSHRNSAEEDISWAFKEMQEHANVLGQTRERVSTLDLDNMSIDSPPSDAMGLTRAARESLSGSPLWAMRAPSSGSLGPIGEGHMPLLRADSPLPTIGESALPYPTPASPPIRPIGESHMPYIPSAAPGKAANMPYVSASQIPAETNFRSHGSPFRRFGQDPDTTSRERAKNLHRLKDKSPPMLGKELVFRRCPSPKLTKLEPDHLWDLEAGTTWEEPNRDSSETRGLWRGYCYTNSSDEQLAATDRPPMVSTPLPPPTPGVFPNYFSAAPATLSLSSDEPTPGSVQSWYSAVPADQRHRTPQPKGLHLLQGLDERLRREKLAAEREELIIAEFDDTFITQVYNYLSLGYPALARGYDEELSKISRISVDDLEHDDGDIMEDLWSGKRRQEANGVATTRSSGDGMPTGHIMIDSEEKQGVSEEERCPRWKALRLYIYEWARQHPDLNSISPLAWGVRERRGSWGI